MARFKNYSYTCQIHSDPCPASASRLTEVMERMGHDILFEATKRECERSLIYVAAYTPFPDVMRLRPSKEETPMRSIAILPMLICAACLSGCAGGDSGPGAR